MSNYNDQQEVDRFDLDAYKEYYEEGNSVENVEDTVIPETKKRSSRKKLLLFSPLLFVIVGAGYLSWKPIDSSELIASSKNKVKSNVKTIALSKNAADNLVSSENATENVEEITAIVEMVMAKMDQGAETELNEESSTSEGQSSQKRLTKLLLDTEEALVSSSSDDDSVISKNTEKIRAVSKAAVVAYNEVTEKPQVKKGEHQVRSGDTFFSIARRHDTTVRKITAYNHMKDDDKLKIGSILKIPPKGYMPKEIKSDSRSFASASKVKAANKKKVQAAKATKVKKIASVPKNVVKKKHSLAKNDTYKVKKGDTLNRIAERYHVSSRVLKKVNKIKSSKSLRLGQVLTIPGKSSHAKTKQRLAKRKAATLKKRLASSSVTFSKKSAHKSKKSKLNFLALGSVSSKSHLELSAAKKQLGKRYVWGATGPYNFDCSGFTRYVCKKSGVCIPRTSRNQAKVGKRISRNHLKAGDLIFFDTSKDKKGYVNHVGIYLGNNKFIHASSAKKKVVITSLNKPFYKARFKWGSRVKG